MYSVRPVQLVSGCKLFICNSLSLLTTSWPSRACWASWSRFDKTNLPWRWRRKPENQISYSSSEPRTGAYLIISLAQELELLSFLVHEDSIKVSSLHTPYLYGLVAPAHDLSGPDVGHAGGQLPPLEDDVLGHLQGRTLKYQDWFIEQVICCIDAEKFSRRLTKK